MKRRRTLSRSHKIWLIISLRFISIYIRLKMLIRTIDVSTWNLLKHLLNSTLNFCSSQKIQRFRRKTDNQISTRSWPLIFNELLWLFITSLLIIKFLSTNVVMSIRISNVLKKSSIILKSDRLLHSPEIEIQ